MENKIIWVCTGFVGANHKHDTGYTQDEWDQLDPDEQHQEEVEAVMQYIHISETPPNY